MKKAPDQATKSPRTDARKSKLRDLTPEQRGALLTWLFKDKLTYDAVRNRLVEKFGISLGKATVHRFWDENSRAQLMQSDRETLLDVIIETGCPVRLTVHPDGKTITLSKLP